MNSVEEELLSHFHARSKRIGDLWKQISEKAPTLKENVLRLASSSVLGAEENESRFPSEALEFVKAAREAIELDAWVYPNGKRDGRKAYQMFAPRVDHEFGKLLEESLSKGRKGRPPMKRQAAVQALELVKSRPDLSWGQITIQCCPCKKAKHDFTCQEQLRQARMKLEGLLSRVAES